MDAVLQYAYEPKHKDLYVRIGGLTRKPKEPRMGSYILIDRNQMAITHKHNDRVVLNGLAWIECTAAAAIMSLTNTRPLLDFTPAELRLIYKNATGAELKGYANTLAQAVLDAAKRMPDTVAILAEVEAQRKLVEDGDKSSFKYVLGAMKPEEVVGLFEAPPITVPRVEAEELRAAQGYAGPAFGGTGPDQGGAGTSGAPREPRAPSAPRTGGAREVIFRVADEMWAAAGSPTALPTVLALRKTIMQELETNHSVKKTTSSTALGEWQKQRLG